MPSVTVQLRNIAGTEASLGWSEGRTLVVDRKTGSAGGMGLGFSGSQLLSLAIGGCFCNTLRKVAYEKGVRLGRIDIDVHLDMDGEPLITKGARIDVVCETTDGEAATDVVAEARRVCMVSQSVANGFPVAFI